MLVGGPDARAVLVVVCVVVTTVTFGAGEMVAPPAAAAATAAAAVAAAAVAASHRDVQALVTGESIGQVSTQTLTNVATLDRLIDLPVLRPLIGLDKTAIMDLAAEIGTLELSSRTRETCDISGGARVSVATPPGTLAAVLAEVDDLVELAVTTAKSMRLADWVPGS